MAWRDQRAQGQGQERVEGLAGVCLWISLSRLVYIFISQLYFWALRDFILTYLYVPIVYPLFMKAKHRSEFRYLQVRIKGDQIKHHQMLRLQATRRLFGPSSKLRIPDQ
jgi:hypothetical protein